MENLQMEPSGHLGKAMLKGLKKHRNNIFQIECISGQKETCGSVRLRSIKVALMMKTRGLEVGDMAMIVATNHLDSCIPFIACQYIGITPICLVVGMTKSECKHLIGLSKPSLVFSDPEMVQVISDALDECGLKPEIVVFGELDGCTAFRDFQEPYDDDDEESSEEESQEEFFNRGMQVQNEYYNVEDQNDDGGDEEQIEEEPEDYRFANKRMKMNEDYDEEEDQDEDEDDDENADENEDDNEADDEEDDEDDIEDENDEENEDENESEVEDENDFEVDNDDDDDMDEGVEEEHDGEYDDVYDDDVYQGQNVHRRNDDRIKFKCDEFDTKKILALAACSSGTTGLPKLVGSTHDATLKRLYLKWTATANISDEFGSQLVVSPLYWSIGFISVITSCLLGQCRISASEKFTLDMIVEAVEKYEPVTALLTPVLAHALVKSPEKRKFPSLRYIFLIGGPVDPETMEKINEMLPNGKALMRYGCTEIGSISASPVAVRGSVGKLYTWHEWKIVDVDTEELLGPNQKGELRIKSLTMFQCYINDPDSTKAALDSMGFYKTGDLVYRDDQQNLFVVDRIKEVIKYQNHQVSTVELQSLISTIPGVFMVGVVGVHSDEDGELPLAFVEKMPGCEVTEKEIKDLVKDTLADWKQLRGGVIFMDKLPVTHSGKIDRKALKNLANNRV